MNMLTNRIIKVRLAIILISLFCIIGCGMKDFVKITEFEEGSIPKDMINASKEEVKEKWGVPDRVYTKHDRLSKYEADELWLYKPKTQRKRYDTDDEKRMYVSEGVDEYLYFRDDQLIKIEYLSWGNF